MSFSARLHSSASNTIKVHRERERVKPKSLKNAVITAIIVACHSVIAQREARGIGN